MSLEGLTLGSHVILKKTHPCGNNKWEIIRTGADFKIKCCGCGHLLMIPRSKLEKSLSGSFKNKLIEMQKSESEKGENKNTEN